MSVVGIDLGNINTVIAVARNRGVDIICNEVSNRMTPSLASFGPKNRYLGESAKTQEISNFRNTVGNLKRLLGRTLAEVQETEGEFFNCELAEKDGCAAVRVNYCGEEATFTGVELMAMYLSKLKDTTQAEVKNSLMDIVLSVPPYFNDRQRRALLDAAEIAQVRCLRLFNENTASALAYGMPKTDLPEDQFRHVCFVDVGESAYSVTIVALKKGQLEVKGVGFDANFGGRNFDFALAEHFCNEFKAKRKLDIRSNRKAFYRLRAACERVKKVLSANPVTTLSVENIMEDVDIQADINRTIFEELCAPLMSRFAAPITAALAMANLDAQQIDSIELVGGSTRVPAIKEQLLKIFGKDLNTTLNQDEAIARGCALQCALHSPVFKVRDFSLQDIVPGDGVKYTWEPLSEAPEDFEYEVFPSGHHIPSTKMLSFKRAIPFTISTAYSSGSGRVFGRYVIGTNGTNFDPAIATVKVKSRVNPSGVFSIEGASIIFEDPATPSINLQVIGENGSLSRKELDCKEEAEASMHSTDRLVADTADSKNALEEYIYEMRSKVEEGGSLERFASPEEKSKLATMLRQAEEWLYGEGEESTKSIYATRLQELKVVGGPIFERFREHEAIPHAQSIFAATIQEYTNMAHSTEERYAHIEAKDRSKVLEECRKKQFWLNDILAKQNARPLHQALLVTSTQLIEEKNRLINVCFPIMNKAKPKVEKPAAPKDAETKEAEAKEEELLITDEEENGQDMADD